MAKNHPLIKDVKNWILDSFSFMDAVGYDILFDDDIYGMENTKAISADIDGLTDFDFEKGKKNLLNSIPNKIKAEFPYLRITSRKDGDYFIMFIVLLDNNDYLEDKNIQYINLNESKESTRKSIKESVEFFNDWGTGVYCATSSNGWTFCYCPLSWINKKGVEDLIGWSVMDDEAHYIEGDSWENKTDEEINDSIDNFEKSIKKYAKEDAKEIIKDFRSTLDKD